MISFLFFYIDVHYAKLCTVILKYYKQKIKKQFMYIKLKSQLYIVNNINKTNYNK